MLSIGEAGGAPRFGSGDYNWSCLLPSDVAFSSCPGSAPGSLTAVAPPGVYLGLTAGPAASDHAGFFQEAWLAFSTAEIVPGPRVSSTRSFKIPFFPPHPTPNGTPGQGYSQMVSSFSENLKEM